MEHISWCYRYIVQLYLRGAIKNYHSSIYRYLDLPFKIKQKVSFIYPDLKEEQHNKDYHVLAWLHACFTVLEERKPLGSCMKAVEPSLVIIPGVAQIRKETLAYSPIRQKENSTGLKQKQQTRRAFRHSFATNRHIHKYLHCILKILQLCSIPHSR